MSWMPFSLVLLVITQLLLPIEATIGPSHRNSASRPAATVPSSSPFQVVTPAATGLSHDPPSVVDTDVVQRRLLEENPSAQSILDNHQSYCVPCRDRREFTQPSLVYITPWNNHGYDMLKIFTKKFDYVAPVWFSVRRTSFENYVIEGTQDIDSNWVELLKGNHRDLRVVPRVVFEKWPGADVHALLESEDEIEKLVSTMANFLVEYSSIFDGYVLDLLLQFRSVPKASIHHLLQHISERVHQIEHSDNTTRKEILLVVSPNEDLFDENDFAALQNHIDGFSIMTFDSPTQEPGPVSPIGKPPYENEDILMPVSAKYMVA